MDIPLSRTRAGEETYAEQHIGTQYASRSTGKPIQVMYSPQRDIYQIMNGHHRAVEARAAGQPTIKARVSIYNERKGFGALTESELETMF